MNFSQFITILWSRKGIVLSALMMTVITALVASLSLPRQYVATVAVVAEQRSINPVTGVALPVQLLPAYIATQVDVITSHNVARKVVEKLHLADDPKMRKDFAKSKNTGDIKDWVADSLLKELDITPSHESSMIKIDFTAKEPRLAAAIANGFADAYIQTSLELHTQPAKLSADWFDAQLASLREHLEHAQSVLSTYEQQHGIVATDERLDLESSRLSDLSKQLVESQARTGELQSRKDLLTATLKQGGSSESLQEVLSNSLVQSLKSELAKAEARFAELSKRLDVNHPLHQQAKAEVNSLQQQTQAEIKRVLSNISSGLASSSQRDKILANALAEQKAKVLELKKQHDDIAVFNREVENAQNVYDAAMQRAVQNRMESEMSQTNIAILNPALPPQKHAKPSIRLNLILSVFLGGLLGVGSALLAELTDRRVRSAYDISELLAIPVFAVVSARSSKPRRMAWLFHSPGVQGDSPYQGNA